MRRRPMLRFRRCGLVVISIVALFVPANTVESSEKIARSASEPATDDGLKVAGVVRDQEGKVVEGAVLQVFSAGNRVTSDSQGRFDARWRRSMVHTEQEPYLMAWHIRRNLTAAIIIDESSDEIEVTLKPGIVLTGQVTDNSGKPIQNAGVLAVVRLGRWSSIIGETIRTNANGRFVVYALPQWHELQVYAGADGYGRSNVIVPAHMATGERQDVGRLRLNPANLSVSGKIVDVNDQPVVDATLRVEGKGQPKIRNIRPDKEGRFRIQGVCEGPLELYANTLAQPRMYARLESYGGDTDAKVILEPRGISDRSRPTEPAPRLGKGLLDPKELGIDLEAIEAKGRQIILCFFDLEQRPSRNCLRQLGKRAQELKEKDVVVIAAHASELEEKTLKEWVKTNRIPFTVGMIRGEVEKTKLTWGVRSLPWLILTDHRHVVCAEGFGLDELGQKLSATASIASERVQVDPTQDRSASVSASGNLPEKPEERSRPASRLIRVVGVTRDQNGKPVAGVEVQRLHGPGPVSTDAGGKFELTWDPARNRPLVDTYYIIARHEQKSLSAVVEVPEFKKEAEMVSLRLLPGVIFKGKVVDPTGRAIELAKVGLLLHTPTQGSGLYDTLTDCEGVFEFRGIPADHKYSFLAKRADYGTTWVHNIYVGHDFARKSFGLEPIVLAIADQTVSGLVVDANGKPVSDARLSTDGQGQPQHCDIRADAEGKFTIDEVCAGNVRIFATVRGETLLSGYADTEGGATNVRIVMVEVPSPGGRRSVRKSPPSLVGRTLPEWKNLGIEVSSAEAARKKMLLCFFDFEQRPSRYCISQLAKQAEQLENKGLAIMVIQISKVDEDRLNEWITKNNIPLAIGTVEGDRTKTRSTYGVKSLPWLILTDKEHIVRAEGFSLGELEEKVRENENVQE